MQEAFLDSVIRNQHIYTTLSEFATVNPEDISGANPATLSNYINGQWKGTEKYDTIIDPLNGEGFIKVPVTSTDEELKEFQDSLLKCPPYGLHNPLFKPERYSIYGEVAFKAVAALRDPEIHNFFVRAIQRVCPKSFGQAEYEVLSVRHFM